MDSSSAVNETTHHDRLEPEKRESAEASMLDSKGVPKKESAERPASADHALSVGSSGNGSKTLRGLQGLVGQGGQVLLKLAKFIGPGFMVYVIFPSLKYKLTKYRHQFCGVYRSWELCHRHRRRRKFSVQAIVHYPHVQCLRHLPPVTMYQTRDRNWKEPCPKLQRTSPHVAQYHTLHLRRIGHHCNRHRRGEHSPTTIMLQTTS